MSIFSEDLFAKGVNQRVSTVGEDYVKKNLEEALEGADIFFGLSLVLDRKDY